MPALSVLLNKKLCDLPKKVIKKDRFINTSNEDIDLYARGGYMLLQRDPILHSKTEFRGLSDFYPKTPLIEIPQLIFRSVLWNYRELIGENIYIGVLNFMPNCAIKVLTNPEISKGKYNVSVLSIMNTVNAYEIEHYKIEGKKKNFIDVIRLYEKDLYEREFSTFFYDIMGLTPLSDEVLNKYRDNIEKIPDIYRIWLIP